MSLHSKSLILRVYCIHMLDVIVVVFAISFGFLFPYSKMKKKITPFWNNFTIKYQNCRKEANLMSNTHTNACQFMSRSGKYTPIIVAGLNTRFRLKPLVLIRILWLSTYHLIWISYTISGKWHFLISWRIRCSYTVSNFWPHMCPFNTVVYVFLKIRITK